MRGTILPTDQTSRGRCQNGAVWIDDNLINIRFGTAWGRKYLRTAIVKTGEVSISEPEPQHAVWASSQRASGRDDRFWILLNYPQTVNTNQFVTAATDLGPNIVSGVFRNADNKMSRATFSIVNSVKVAVIVAIQVIVEATPEPTQAVFENGRESG